jgi:hypothetical protein
MGCEIYCNDDLRSWNIIIWHINYLLAKPVCMKNMSAPQVTKRNEWRLFESFSCIDWYESLTHCKTNVVLSAKSGVCWTQSMKIFPLEEYESLMMIDWWSWWGFSFLFRLLLLFDLRCCFFSTRTTTTTINSELVMNKVTCWCS